MTAPAKIWRACLTSERFEFEGYGASEADAVAAMESALREHARQCALRRDWWRHGYDYEVRAIQLGAGYRDGMPCQSKRRAA